MDSDLNQLLQNKATEGLGNFSATVLIAYQSLTTVTRENISGNTGNTFPKSHLIPSDLGSIKHTYESKIINYQDIEHVKYLEFLSGRPSPGLYSFINLSRLSQTTEILNFWKEFFPSLRWDFTQSSLEKETYADAEAVLKLSSGGSAVSSLKVSSEASPRLTRCLDTETG